MPFWVKVADVLSGQGTLSVILVSLITASRIILRPWKTVKHPNMKEWVDTVVETASYESMHNRLIGKLEDGTAFGHI